MSTLRLAQILVGGLLCVSIAGCESDQDKQLASAQSCLNTATYATVDTCLIPIAGQTTEASYAIRCAADFIAQRIDAVRLENAFKDLSSGNNSVKPMLTAIAYMAFYASLPTGHTADNAVSNCTLSQADSYRRIAEFTKYASTMAPQTSASTVQTTATAKTTISTNLGNGGIVASVGAQTQVLYQDFCVKKSPFSNTDICTTLQTYKDSGTNTQVGTAIMTYLAM